MKSRTSKLFAICSMTTAFLQCATAGTFFVVTTNDNGPGSFREAIINANLAPGTDTVAFNIPPGGPASIYLTSAPPVITDSIVIDGTTQPGFAGLPFIEITRSFNDTYSFQGIRIEAGNSIIRGLIINRSGGGDAIGFYNCSNNVIEGNWLGLRHGGTNTTSNNYGITLWNSSHNIVGGTNATQRNVISGNYSGGMQLYNSSENLIRGNFVGTDVTGAKKVGDQRWGISIWNGTNNVIGGSSPDERNVISGNRESGVYLQTGTRNRVIGNFIGTDVLGRVALTNGTEGVYASGQNFTDIGGITPGEGNVISGNGNTGIFLNVGNGNYSNRVQGNFIGVDVTGTNALSNRGYGLYIDNNGGVLVGGVTASARNVISANLRSGLFISSGFNTNASWVQGNIIGLDVTGVKSLPNSGYGIEGGTSKSFLTVGGANFGEGNIVSANTLGGIWLGSSPNTNSSGIILGNVIGLDQTAMLPRGNGGPGITIGGFDGGLAIRSNRIAYNSGLGIDLLPLGVSPNDSSDNDTGANGLQNFPLITAATNTGTSLIITGSLQSAALTTYELDLFVNDFSDSSGYGEGQFFLGSVNVQTDIAGQANISASFPSVAGRFITATATSPTGDTSEFSPYAWVTGLPEDFGLVVRRGPPIRVEWSSAAVGYTLQSTLNLSPPIQWTTITGGIQDNGIVRYWVQNHGDLSSPATRYFRLSKP